LSLVGGRAVGPGSLDRHLAAWSLRQARAIDQMFDRAMNPMVESDREVTIGLDPVIDDQAPIDQDRRRRSHPSLRAFPKGRKSPLEGDECGGTGDEMARAGNRHHDLYRRVSRREVDMRSILIVSALPVGRK